jgi:Aspartyl protease
MAATPFDRVHHLVVVPVDGVGPRRFVLDTGIGLTLLSKSLCDAIGCDPTGSTFTGKRMSGQELTVPLVDAPPLSMAGVVLRDDVVGVLDTSGFSAELAKIDGFLSLAFFAETAFTVDYAHSHVIIESPATLDERVRSGAVVPVRIEREGPSVDAFLRLDIPGGRTIEVEIDMGSDSLVLAESLAPEVGVDLARATVRRVEGSDETGHRYTRYFTELSDAIRVTDAPAVAQRHPEVMFQRIIYNGLVGDAFLRRFTVTYDVPRERVIFGDAPRAV